MAKLIGNAEQKGDSLAKLLSATIAKLSYPIIALSRRQPSSKAIAFQKHHHGHKEANINNNRLKPVATIHESKSNSELS